MHWMFYVALPCLLIAMLMVYRMRRRHLEISRLRHEAEISQSSPHSIDEWREQAQASLRKSRARRGVEQEEDYGSVA